MKGLLPLTLLLALLSTGAILLLALPRAAPVSSDPSEDPLAGPALVSEAGVEAVASADENPIRLYQTTATLLEDLRDALPEADARLAEEVRRVSKALATRARWTLLELAPQEASPRLRALLVYCAGVHLPDEEALLDYLQDRSPEVREAAALAAAASGEGRSGALLLGRMPVALGRAMTEETRRRIEGRNAGEANEGVRGTLAAVLAAARATPLR